MLKHRAACHDLGRALSKPANLCTDSSSIERSSLARGHQRVTSITAGNNSAIVVSRRLHVALDHRVASQARNTPLLTVNNLVRSWCCACNGARVVKHLESAFHDPKHCPITIHVRKITEGQGIIFLTACFRNWEYTIHSGFMCCSTSFHDEAKAGSVQHNS